MTDMPDFAKLVPGFDFLQGLMTQAGKGVPPQLGQWIAPTIDPEELDKRIEQLKTVQFWLEQNARMLGATVQALEVQRMTLSALKTMHVPVADLSEALKMRVPTPPAAAAEPPAAPAADPDPAPARAAAPKPRAAAAATPTAAGGADPMAWWGALTQQFGELAARTMKDMAAELPPTTAGAAPARQAAKAPGTAKKSRPTKARKTAPAKRAR